MQQSCLGYSTFFLNRIWEECFLGSPIQSARIRDCSYSTWLEIEPGSGRVCNRNTILHVYVYVYISINTYIQVCIHEYDMHIYKQTVIDACEHTLHSSTINVYIYIHTNVYIYIYMVTPPGPTSAMKRIMSVLVLLRIDIDNPVNTERFCLGS